MHARGINDPEWRSYQRVKGLHDFTLTEYVRHIEVVEMPKSLPTFGPVLYYLFPRGYPICDSHVQKLRGKHHVTVLSGRPPRHPGNNPKRGAKESDRSYSKRLLQWKLKADVYGRTMGSILSPWDRHGNCQIHSYEEFEQERKSWDFTLEQLKTDRGWRFYISRDRELDNDKTVPPSPDRFPDPRPASRKLHAHNLGVNLRVPKLMKQIANKWRYQNCDRFDNPKEYDFRNSEDGNMTEKDKENAIAIASLLETFSQSQKNHVVTGIREETADYLNKMRIQIERLYDNGNRDKKYSDTPTNIGLDINWYHNDRTGNVQWAKKTLKEIMERKPDSSCLLKPLSKKLGSAKTDDDLRLGMSVDKLEAFNLAVECFDANKPLRIFIHGGPGTGKTFLARRIIHAARLRGMNTRFTALSGAAATINGGTTIHYAMGMTKTTKWGTVPTANQIKKIRHRNSNMRVLIIDEISMSHAQMWNQILEHLRHAGLLDDLHIIAMGDMCQLPPPNQFVKPIYEDFVLAARKPTSYLSLIHI